MGRAHLRWKEFVLDTVVILHIIVVEYIDRFGTVPEIEFLARLEPFCIVWEGCASRHR